jgi:hypothetical protein
LTPASFDDVFSEGVAGLLGYFWRQAWHDFGVEDRGEISGEQPLAHARGLLSLVIGSYRAADIGDFECALAFSVLQDIGEGYALLSETRRVGGDPYPAMPDRPVLEEFIRATQLDAWCRTYGVELDLMTPAPRPPRASSAGRTDDPALPPQHEATMAGHFSKAFARYPQFLVIAEDPRYRAQIALRRSKYRGEVCATLSIMRQYFYLVGALPDRGGVLRRAAFLQRLIQDSRFLASTLDGPSDRVPLMPQEVVEALAERTGVTEWLNSHT